MVMDGAVGEGLWWRARLSLELCTDVTVSEGHGKDLSVSETVPFPPVIQWSMKVLPLPDSSATGRL